MKLIIYWLTLMIISPFLYLFLAKKPWRLILGIIVVVVLIGGYWLPGKLAFSILQKELKKVEEKMDQEGWSERGKEKERWQWEKLDEEIKNVSQQEITSKNQEKVAVAKEIIKWNEEIKKAKQEEEKLEKEKKKYFNDFSPEAIKAEENIRKKLKEEISPRMTKGYKMEHEKKWEYARKWGGKEDPPVFWFCGEEFNYELTKRRTGFKQSWKMVEDWDWHSDVIDFGKYGNEKPDFIKKRIREIWNYWDSGITRGRFVDDYPIILLKNADKITNSALAKELLMITDHKKNAEYGKYQIKDWNGEPTGEEGNIDLSKFILVVTSSSSKLPNDLRANLKYSWSFLDKYFWIIFFFSGGAEIIIFFLIKKVKSKNGKWTHENLSSKTFY